MSNLVPEARYRGPRAALQRRYICDSMLIRITSTDRALLDRAFRIADPKSLENLSPTVPVATDIPIVEYEYDATPFVRKPGDRPDVWCAHCGHDTHWKGFVMRYEDGVRILVGKDCGLKIYGASFDGIEREFSRLKDRQSQLRRLVARLQKLPELATCVQSLATHPAYVELAAIRPRLMRELRALVSAIGANALRPDPMLFIAESQRDFDAESRRSIRIEAAKREYALLIRNKSPAQIRKMERHGELPRIESEGKPMFKEVERPLMQLLGGKLLTHDIDAILSMIAQQANALTSLHNTFHGRASDTLSDRDFAHFDGLVDGIVRDVEMKMSTLAEMMAFFDPSHLRSLAEWASQKYEAGGTYRAAGRSISFSPRDGNSDDIQAGMAKDIELPLPTVLRDVLST